MPLIGRSPAMQEIYRVLARLMQTDLTVMITGESGTGKELVARALHDYGKRRSGPFVAINMAAIPRDLIECELFGHEKGAFTGAKARIAGRFEQAEGGTLFLDEIGDMPMEAQTRLLRVLQQGEYTTVGGRTPIKTDVRIIAATNKDLRILIQQGLFREDLFFRAQRRAAAAAAACASASRTSPTWSGISSRRPSGRACRTSRSIRRRSIASSATTGRATCANWKILRAGSPRSIRRKRSPPRSSNPNLRNPRPLPRRRNRRADETLSAAVERNLARYFAQLRRQLAAARPLPPHPARGGISAADRGARGDPRQPDPRRRPAGRQPQYLAQEDPRSGHSGVPQRTLEGRLA